MQELPLSTLKEIRPHGTKFFPCAIYHTRSAAKKGICIKHHWHDEIEIIYFSGGEFNLEINMEHYHVTSECFYFINAGELHSIVVKKAEKCGEDAIVFHPMILSFESYDSAQLDLMQPILNGKLLFPRCLTPDHPAFASIRLAFTQAIQSFGIDIDEKNPSNKDVVTDDLASQLLIKASLLRIFGILYQYELFIPTDKNYNKKVEGIKKALTYIKENYKEKIYIADLASLLNMNEQYFCRYFKKALDHSPIEYINKYRIKQALSLLEKTDLSVMEICLECGYNNLGNFLREFRKYTNTTPLQYRKNAK